MKEREDTRTRALAAALRARLPVGPEFAVVLGSGLSAATGMLTDRVAFDARALPHFPVPAIAGHQPVIHAGTVAGRPVIVIAGRVHLYEGYTLDDVTRPVRALARLGVRGLVLTNTAGSVRGELTPGTILAAGDAFQWMGASFTCPPRDRADDDALEAAMRLALEDAARDHAIRLEPGVLAAGLGPCYETRAEVLMLRRLGADALTMSTVPELVAARRAGIPTQVLTVITNWATGLAPGTHLTHAEVTERGTAAVRDLAQLISELVVRLPPAASSGRRRPHRPRSDW